MNSKKFLVSVLSLVLVFSGISPVISHAKTSKTKAKVHQQHRNEYKLTKKEFNEFVNKTDVRWEKTTLASGEEEYILSDAQLMQYLRDTGQEDVLNKVQENQGIQLLKAGVTKVKKNKYGGYDLYLSKLFIQTLAVGGSAAVGALVALIPGVGWTVAGTILGAMSAHLSENIKNGKVFRFNKSWKLMKVWSQ